MVNFETEIPKLPLPAEARSARDYNSRRRALQSWMERADLVSATSVVVEDSPTRTLVLMISVGRTIVDGREVHTSDPLSVELRPRLATISGRPFASKEPGTNAHLPRGFKVGLVGLEANQLRDRQTRGGTTIVTRDFGAEFECDLKTAVRILSEYGFRTSGPDLAKWLVYEVGGPLEHDLACWLADSAREKDDSRLLTRAHSICPDAVALGQKKEKK